MIFCDTHAHLYSDDFDDDRDAVVHHAIDSGVKYLFLPNIDSTSVKAMHAMTERFPDNCFPMMGLHPTSVKENYLDELRNVAKNLSKRKYAAVGEVGMDFYWDRTFVIQQSEAFTRQVELSLDYDLPLVIHTRNSFDQTMDLLRPYIGRVRGIFHCFSGNADQAQRAIDSGFLLGIGGVITFRNSGLQAVVKKTDLKYLVLETDAPYLSPEPHRGERNESSYIPFIAGKVAEIKEVRLDIVAETTTRSALDMFGIKTE